MDAIALTLLVVAIATTAGALMISLLGRTSRPGVTLGYHDPLSTTTTELPVF